MRKADAKRKLMRKCEQEAGDAHIAYEMALEESWAYPGDDSYRRLRGATRRFSRAQAALAEIKGGAE
jgi:hypothetical protein